MRGRLIDHVAVRLADEGVPIRALARAMNSPAGDMRRLVAEAVAQGHIATMPADDWSEGSRMTARPSAAVAIDADELDPLVPQLMLGFNFKPAEARFVAILLLRGQAARPTLQLYVSKPGVNAKSIDVHALRIRRRLALEGIVLTSVWGRGYALEVDARERIVAKLEALRAGRPEESRDAA